MSAPLLGVSTDTDVNDNTVIKDAAALFSSMETRALARSRNGVVAEESPVAINIAYLVTFSLATSFVVTTPNPRRCTDAVPRRR